MSATRETGYLYDDAMQSPARSSAPDAGREAPAPSSPAPGARPALDALADAPARVADIVQAASPLNNC